MKLMFIGAAHEVTGSCHYLEACGLKILIDCGMEQGSNKYENAELPVSYGDIDYVLVTHSHIDHVGLLPLIFARGFSGQVMASRATCDLCNIMLKDCAHIQESEAEWKNRKAKRAGRPQEPPLYTMADAEGVLKHFVPCSYNEIIRLADGVEIRFTDAGHLLGSAFIEVWLTEDGCSKKIVFSGDIGNLNKPLIRNPQYIAQADYVVMESTYGDRFHKHSAEHIEEFARVIQETLDRGGNVVIPAFAVGRTQEVLYYIRRIKEEGLVTGHGDFVVYVDSPLAVEATQVFNNNMLDCYNDETKALVKKGVNPISFKGLKLSVSSEDSVAINFDAKPKVIISAAGMCDAGRIRHHLKHNLWRKECTILFVGYQAVGTLGRKLVESKPESVRLFGENVEVNARIEVLAGISGHADMNGLLNWIDGFKEKPSHIFVVHGEDSVTDSFAATITDRFGIPAFAPYSGGCVDLATDTILSEGIRLPKKAVEKPVKARALTAFNRVVAAAKHLMDVVLKNEGLANKDLAKFESQIQNLADKWDRDDR